MVTIGGVQAGLVDKWKDILTLKIPNTLDRKRRRLPSVHMEQKKIRRQRRREPGPGHHGQARFRDPGRGPLLGDGFKPGAVALRGRGCAIPPKRLTAHVYPIP